MTASFSATLLAPCGMNCAVCYAHLRRNKPCPGCRAENAAQAALQPPHCRECSRRTCAEARAVDSCAACAKFPCAAIKRLDKSYTQRFRVSLVDMARRRLALGTAKYLREESRKWTCAVCGGVVCLHDRVCADCGQAVPVPETAG